MKMLDVALLNVNPTQSIAGKYLKDSASGKRCSPWKRKAASTSGSCGLDSGSSPGARGARFYRRDPKQIEEGGDGGLCGRFQSGTGLYNDKRGG